MAHEKGDIGTTRVRWVWLYMEDKVGKRETANSDNDVEHTHIL